MQLARPGHRHGATGYSHTGNVHTLSQSSQRLSKHGGIYFVSALLGAAAIKEPGTMAQIKPHTASAPPQRHAGQSACDSGYMFPQESGDIEFTGMVLICSLFVNGFGKFPQRL